jgi:hypothetical protein
MSHRAKFIFAGCVFVHVIVSWFAAAWCVGVSMAILDSGGTEAPPSLSAMCLAHVVTSYPLTHFILRGAASVQPAYWLPLLINSFVAISIIWFVVRALPKLFRSHRPKLANEQT